MTRNARRLLKSDASPSERDGRVREKDAGSANSSAICATEDVLSRRPVRSEGRGFVFQQPPSVERHVYPSAYCFLPLSRNRLQ